MSVLIKLLSNHLGISEEEAESYHEDNYIECCDTIAEFVLDSLKQCNDFPDILVGHVDLEGVWDCELRHDYFYIESDDELHFYINV